MHQKLYFIAQMKPPVAITESLALFVSGAMLCPSATSSAILSAIGTISDGQGFYLSRKTCTWVIAPPNVTSIQLTFSEFATEKTYDTLTIYQCSSLACSNPIILGSFSGVALPRPVTAGTGIMKLVFVSDQIVVDQGFTAVYVGLCPAGYYRSFVGEQCLPCTLSCRAGKTLSGNCTSTAFHADPVQCNCPAGQFSPSFDSPCWPCVQTCKIGQNNYAYFHQTQF